MVDTLFVVLQRLLPRHALTAAVYHITRLRTTWFKNWLIKTFVRVFAVDTSETRAVVPEGYDSFNAFFIRELADGARPVDDAAAALVSPVDGTVSVAGRLQIDSIVQAKGLNYSVHDLLATDLPQSRAFVDGGFATLYLAPYNYHRVHAPVSGRLTAIRYVPGDLFSVNDVTVRQVPGLFRRNERLIMHIESPFGLVAVVFVGALNVGSISTPWTGEIRPARKGMIRDFDLARQSAAINRGDLLGWFNMGSTVIVLTPTTLSSWNSGLQTGARVRMGEAIGMFHGVARAGALDP